MAFDPLQAAYSLHPRTFRDFRHAYPVLSRRSGGISIGVNLNPDRRCNFDCPYCQVDRRTPSPDRSIDRIRLVSEVSSLLDGAVRDGLQEVFPQVDASRRSLRDIALSGDGEPTLSPLFPEICQDLAALQERWIGLGHPSFPLILITNATLLERPAVRKGLEALCGLHGEIWGKLDAGTEELYRSSNASKVPFQRILDNLALTAAHFPLRIQTLFLERDGHIPSPPEIDAWIARIEEIVKAGQILSVQLHTVARATALPGCRPLSLAWLQDTAGLLVGRTGLSCSVHQGQESGSFVEQESPDLS